MVGHCNAYPGKDNQVVVDAGSMENLASSPHFDAHCSQSKRSKEPGDD